MRPAIKPLVRLALTFAIVWFYHALLSGFLSGWVLVVAVISLAIPTWLLVSRALFPANVDQGPLSGFRGKD